MQDYEILGKFYLGREYDLAARQVQTPHVLYDAKDLTTHAVCVGMTGSGKTGLCLSLLEEAALDGIPAIAIDPKGDLGNLCLTFPQLQAGDFRPWIDEAAALRAGLSPDEFAAKTAETWRSGLAAWDQTPDRIEKFRQAVDLTIYTPASSSGVALTVLRSFSAPPAAVLQDGDAMRERIVASTSGLLALMGIEGDPLRSREHILIAQLFERAWRSGRDLDLASLIREIQQPPLEKVGFVDLETFYPAKDRFALSMQLNSLLASPSFAAWLEGEPLDVGRLLYTPEGRPRLSILSIAHLSESERMFFVTILLNEVLAWVRSQAGTSSLRALLYMDEVFGYFPPTANPPSKQPMLTLLKQARAYGLGVVLATQNPVDLDYKGLSNAGTWFLGRLQTERDKARVLEGLEGASTAAGASFDRAKMESQLAALGNRVFLMNNVHEDQPTIFQTRWCLSYLRGPLTRQHIQTLMAEKKKSAASAVAPAAGAGVQPVPSATATAGATANAGAPRTAASERPIIPPEGNEQFAMRRGTLAAGAKLVYRPALLGQARVHYVDAKNSIDHWQETVVVASLADGWTTNLWDNAQQIDGLPETEKKPEEGADFASSPPELTRPKTFADLRKSLQGFLYRTQSLELFSAPKEKTVSRPGESEGDFRIRLSHELREQTELESEKISQKYSAKIRTLEDRIRRAEDKVAREKSQYQQSILTTATSVAGAILGAVLGRKVASRANVAGATGAVRNTSRAARDKAEVSRAEDSLDDLLKQLEALNAECEAEVASLKTAREVQNLVVEPYSVRPRKTDLTVTATGVIWLPWRVESSGLSEPVWE